MQTETQTPTDGKGFHIPWMWGFCVFAAIALFFLWEEHRAHILGALPYVLLLLCPLMHLFMHRGHQGGGHGHAQHRPDEEVRHEPRT